MKKITAITILTLTALLPAAVVEAKPQTKKPPTPGRAKPSDKITVDNKDVSEDDDQATGDNVVLGGRDSWNRTPLNTPESVKRLEWFREAKYGMLISWGLFSVPASDLAIKGHRRRWSEFFMEYNRMPIKEYAKLATKFNPTRFNAEKWADVAANAGMKYVVMMVKHKDGFLNYHSAVSAFNCFDATPWKRDALKELQVACAKRHLKLCLYFSAQDWNEPGGTRPESKTWDPAQKGKFEDYVHKVAMPEIKEILTNYGPIGLVWFDAGGFPEDLTKEVANLMRVTAPDTLINSRVGPGGVHDYMDLRDRETYPAKETRFSWETVGMLNESWGFRAGDTRWKSPQTACFKLVDIVSKGGNYLLNMGPDAQGVMPEAGVKTLKAVGDWLKVNGEMIYGAQATPFGVEFGAPMRDPHSSRLKASSKNDWRCTAKDGKLYICFFKWPAAKFKLTGLKNKVTKAYLLADPDRKPLPVTQTDGNLMVSLPEKAPDTLASVLCLENQ